MSNLKRAILLVMAFSLTACLSAPDMSEVMADRKVDYKKSKSAEKDLEVPPDLTKDSIDDSMAVPDIAPSGTATYSEYAGERAPGTQPAPAAAQNVLPSVKDVELKRDGETRWLIINSAPAEVWPVLVSFWQANGILLLEQDPESGVMRTAWLENRADIKSDFITDTLRKAFNGLYSAGTRDQFRVRLEQGEKAGTSELYLTHRGMQEQILKGSTNEGEQSVWVPRETDHGLESVMLRRIMISLGVTENRANTLITGKDGQQQQKARSELQRNKDVVALRINENLERSWRLTGTALDRVGFAVEDRNHQEGVYYVRYNDPYSDQEKSKGMLSKLAFWNEENKKIDKVNQYQVRLATEAEHTLVAVHNDKGERVNSDTAARILTLLHEQIK